MSGFLKVLGPKYHHHASTHQHINNNSKTIFNILTITVFTVLSGPGLNHFLSIWPRRSWKAWPFKLRLCRCTTTRSCGQIRTSLIHLDSVRRTRKTFILSSTCHSVWDHVNALAWDWLRWKSRWRLSNCSTNSGFPLDYLQFDNGVTVDN